MGSGAVNVVWTPNQDIINANTLTPTVFPASDIYYTMTSACGEDSVLVDVVPAINLAPIADDTIHLFGTTTLTAVPSPSSIPIGSVQWTPAAGLNDATSLSVVASCLNNYLWLKSRRQMVVMYLIRLRLLFREVNQSSTRPMTPLCVQETH